MKIGIVNSSLGNVGSVYSAFKFYKQDVSLVETKKDLDESDAIVLAGVGNFPTAVERLKAMGLWEKIDEEVSEKKKPILGICLGMQLFAEVSHEDGKNNGFGWIKGSVEKIPGEVRVPNIGWCEVKVLREDDEIFRTMRYNSFYFMHSYRFIPKERKDVIATTDYNGVEIVSAVRKDNIVGVQFHPEKSQGDGLRILRNFIEVMQ